MNKGIGYHAGNCGHAIKYDYLWPLTMTRKMNTKTIIVVFAWVLLLLPFAHAADVAGSVNTTFNGRCDLISTVIGIEHLSKFERVSGSYHVPRHSQWRHIKNDGWVGIVIPINKYQKPTVLDAPFNGIRFTDLRNHVTVSVVAMGDGASRKGLSVTTKPEIFSEYGKRPLFSYLEESLGIFLDDFCGNPGTEKSVAMFMSSGVLPLHGGSGKTKVYHLTQPRALLLVGADAEQSDFELIFPGKNDDNLNYVFVSAPSEYTHKIIESLQRVED